MLNKIRAQLLSLTAVFTLSLLTLVAPATVLAVGQPAGGAGTVNPPSIANGLCTGANNLLVTNDPSANSCQSIDQNGEGQSQVNRIISDVINVFSVIVGVIAVIMIVVGGFRYITSGGQAEKVTGAKNTILYALIGLIIVALAQVIVKFVLSKATNNS